MEDITIHSGKYASKKSAEILADSLAQAYRDGFEKGYSAAKEGVAVEFIDLGLESGTLWSANPLRKDEGESILYLAYDDAVRLNIPTKEQWDELRNDCTWEYYWDDDPRLSIVRCVGPNGRTIEFNFKGHDYITRSFYFWIKYDKIEFEGYRHAAAIGRDTFINNEKKSFQFPVRLVLSIGKF